MTRSEAGGGRSQVRAVHLVNSLQSSHGGPSRSTTALSDAMVERGSDIRMVTHDDVAEDSLVLPVLAAVTRIPAHPFDEFCGRGELERAVIGPSCPDLLHEHGLWLPFNRGAAMIGRRHGIRRVVSIRGMLTTWALAQSRLKKRVAWILFQQSALRQASLLHVTAAEELDDVRRVGLRTPVTVVPNGVEVPMKLLSLNETMRTALFLSRLHSKKGIDELLAAWRACRPDGWRLVLAGPVEDERIGVRVRAAAEQDASVSYVGEADDVSKWGLYASADLFVLPTHSENFGIVIAEALAAGVPVITTKGAPWSELETHDCGWWTDIGVPPLVEALGHATSVSREELQAMGARGRELVRRNYSWEMIADRMLASYEWVLGRGPKPPWVHSE